MDLDDARQSHRRAWAEPPYAAHNHCCNMLLKPITSAVISTATATSKPFEFHCMYGHFLYQYNNQCRLRKCKQEDSLGLQADGVADTGAALLAALSRHPLRNGDCADAPRLRAHYAAAAPGSCTQDRAQSLHCCLHLYSTGSLALTVGFLLNLLLCTCCSQVLTPLYNYLTPMSMQTPSSLCPFASKLPSYLE